MFEKLPKKLFALAILVALSVVATRVEAQNTSTSVNLSATAGQSVVDVVTNTIYTITGSSISVVNGAKNSVSSISDPSSTAPAVIAVDPALNKIYSVDSISAGLSIFNGPGAATPAAFSQTVTVTGASNPAAIAVNPQTHMIYVAYRGSLNVGVFNGSNGTFVKFVGAGSGPVAIAVNPVTNFIYVATLGNTVVQINGSTNIQGATFNAGTQPASIAVNAATNTVYTANRTSNDFTAINVPGGTAQNFASGCTSPSAMAVNPISNQIFIACAGNSNVAIISGATNTGTSVAVQSGSGAGAAIAVDSATNIAYAQILGGNVTAINGASHATANLTAGNGATSSVAINPATHKAYADAGSALAVIDGATNLANSVPTGETKPVAIAVNPATNKIYVANTTSNDVTVIDGATNAVIDTVPAGTNPQAIAVDPIRNQIYVANSGSNFITVINGATDATAPATDTSAAGAVALDINPVNNQVYVANKTSNNMTVFSTLFNQFTGVTDIGMPAGGTSPSAVAVNPASGQVFVTTSGNSGMTIFDGVQFNSFTFGTCSNPVAVAVNPVTNIAYVACKADGNILVIAGGAGTTPGNQTTLNNSPSGTGPVAIAVNPVTNKIYVANNATSNVTVIDGATNAMTTVDAGGQPIAIAVNPATNKIYVANQSDGTVTVIDGATNTTSTVSTGTSPIAIAVIPNHATIYAANQSSNDVTQVTEAATQANGLITTITPLTNNSTSTATPAFTFSPSNAFTATNASHVYFQVDSHQGAWVQASGAAGGSSFTGTTPVLSAGVHILYAYATDGEESGTDATGDSSEPVIGTIAAYPFLVAPPIAADISPFTQDFGNVAQGSQSAPAALVLINEGAAPLSFSYSFSGPNAADFFDAPGGSCAGLNGVLAAMSNCTVNAVFLPSTTGPESATITFIDNSGGVANAQQSEPLAGTGEPSLSVTVGGSGTGTVKDNFSQINCTTPSTCSALYAQGTTVNLTATPNPGSSFQNWSGACTGSGACGVTLNSNQSVTANFSATAAATCAATDDVWEGGAAGDWSVAANWSSGVPTSSTNVCINNGQSPASHVTLNTSGSSGKLTINVGNTLTLADNSQLVVSGTISNFGLIELLAGNNNVFLVLNGAITLQGGGTVTMTRTAGGTTVINQQNGGSLINVDNTISGAGQIGNNGLALTNESTGVINANSGTPLLLNSNGITNQGLLEATAGAALQIDTTVLNAGGTISSNGSGSNVQLLSGTTVQGGSFATIAGGTLGTTSGNTVTLDGSSHGSITNSGVFTAPDNTSTIISGTLKNNGSILLTTGNNNSFLVMNGAVTLEGGGTITMTRTAGGTTVISQENGGSLTNVNNLIQGAGQIGNNGLVLINQATINANQVGSPLLLNSNGITNHGLLEATAGATLQIITQVLNEGSSIKADGTNSVMQLLSGTTVEGGSIVATNGGTMGAVSGNTITLDGISHGALTITGVYNAPDNSTTVFSGIVNNTGSILETAGNNNTFLVMNGAVMMQGGGTITMTTTAGGTTVINQQNGGSLTNADNLIQGAGQIGNNGMVLFNQATINANEPAVPLLLNASSVTNQGLLEATSGATLQIDTRIFNGGTTILSSGAGSAVQLLSGTTIDGGTLASAAGGTMGVVPGNAVTLDGSSLGPVAIAGIFSEPDNSTTVVNGTLNNTGAIQITAGNNNTFLVVNGGVTLQGGGSITMTQTAGGTTVINQQNGGTLTNVNNLIQGSGQIGNNGLVLINQATIDANAPGALLLLNASNISNHGLIEATSGATLQIDTTINNLGSAITAGDASAIQLLSGTTIQGGTISTSGTGTMGVVNGNVITLDGTTRGTLTNAGVFSGGDNSTTVVNGTINNSGSMQITSGSNNTFLVVNGAVTLQGGGNINMSRTSGGTTVINQENSGTLTNVDNTINAAGQIGNNGLNLVNQGTAIFPSGAVLNTSAFMQSGGFLQIAAGGSGGVNTFNLNGGTALIDGTLSSSGGVIVGANGTLTGEGTISSPINSSGIVEPGDLPTAGVLTTTGTGTYTQTSSGGFEVAISGLIAGTQYSQLNLAGAANLAGAVNIQLVNGFTPALGQQFTILTAPSIAGQFAAINSPVLPAGLGWSLANSTATNVILTVVSSSVTSSTLTVAPQGSGSGNVTDNFALINCTITSGNVSGACSASYQTGSQIIITATPAAGNSFSGWSACTGTTPCTVTLNSNETVNATFVPPAQPNTLTVTEIGTGSGTVTDNFRAINCPTVNCSANYVSGTQVTLTATATGSSTFAGWGGACSGTGTCAVTMNSSLAVTASFAPAPTAINIPFAAGTNVSGMATFDCPSNPNPTQGNPCLDANAHSLAVTLPQVLTPFTLTVMANEVAPTDGNGNCPSGGTVLTDFDCRFVTFFTYAAQGGAETTPLCDAYANGNCVFYSVYDGTPGTEPDVSAYVGPVSWTVSWNNDQVIPAAPYAGSIPRLYEDPDAPVSSTTPYGTNCNAPMQVGNPRTAETFSCQFEFDITTSFDPTKKVDATIGGKTRQFSDVTVAFPPANAGQITVTTVADAATVTPGSAIGFTITVNNSAAGIASGASLNDLLPAGTGVNWSISPAYAGQGTCGISGALGSQVLACSFGNLAASANLSLHITSASASAGTYTSASTVGAADQQVLSVAAITVQSVAAAFSGLSSQTIPFGTASVTLSGTVSAGGVFAGAGENIAITINGTAQNATIVGNVGAFTIAFNTSAIPASANPYVITYSYAGDANLSAATDTSTTLTVSAASQTIAFGTLPASAIYNTSFTATASATSGLPVTIAASGACSIAGSTVTMTSGTGNCSLTAMQSGNANFNAAPQVTQQIAAVKAGSAAAIVSNAPNPSVAGQTVTINFSVTGTTVPSGNVTVSADSGEACTGALVSGAGNCQIAFAIAGTRNLTANYDGDSNFVTSASTAASQTVNPAASFSLTVTEIGTGTGNVSDANGNIVCPAANCSANFAPGTQVILNAAPTGNSAFAGWSGACSGTGACLVTMNSAQVVTASFTPPPASVSVPLAPGTNVTGMATFDCPSNPNPSPGNPCLDPNAHSLAITLPEVLTPFTLTVTSTEVPPTNGNGDCPAIATVLTDFDCRFATFFTYATQGNGDRIVPLCDAYANGNCVVYSVYDGTPGTEPDPSFYVGPVNWNISWNNDQVVPPAPYAGSTPRLYEDPDAPVTSTTPYGTNCAGPMLVGNPPTVEPFSCQFEFDITTSFDPTKKVDATIGGKTRQFSDVVVAFPPANTGEIAVATVPDATTVAPGSAIGFTINVSDSSGGVVSSASLNDLLPAGNGLSWTISPAYNGQGTCGISGDVGSQVLACSFGDVTAGASVSLHIVSPTSAASAGTYTSAATVAAVDQQVLSVAAITVQVLQPVFTGLSSQSIAFGTSTVTLSGNVAAENVFPAAGENVSASINGATQSAAITGSNGSFTTTFNTATIPASATPYVITYSYGGDSKLAAATDSSTTLTVNLESQTITFGALPASAIYGTTFSATANATSGLPVTIAASGACKISASTVTMTSGTGNCTLTATQPGNADFAAAAPVVQNIAAQKAASATSITSNTPNPSTTGQAVAIAFAVTGTTPTGTVVVTASTGETCTGTLANGAGSCTITFTSAGPRTLTANYGGDSNFISSSSAAVSQTVNAVAGSTLTINPPRVNFGDVLLGAFAVREVTLTNSGRSPISIEHVSIQRNGRGEGDDFFAQSFCPRSLAASRSCKIIVVYVPDRDDLQSPSASANLLITDSAAGSPQAVPLTATMINPRASLSAFALNFGSQRVSTSSAAKSVTITNTGTSPLVLNSLRVSGDFAFAAGGSCSATISLAPGQHCGLNITFTPHSRGLREGALSVGDNALIGRVIVVLTGTGN